jgi:hypothetical protein
MATWAGSDIDPTSSNTGQTTRINYTTKRTHSRVLRIGAFSPTSDRAQQKPSLPNGKDAANTYSEKRCSEGAPCFRSDMLCLSTTREAYTHAPHRR